MQITSVLSNIRYWVSRGNRSKWLVFILFATTLFVKTMLFHWTTMHSILLSSLWKAPIAFFAFWGGKIIPVLFVSAFVFIAKRQYWTIVVSVLLDIWCIANLFYFKANGFFLTFDMIFIVSNMDGFWGSLHAYMGWDILAFPIISICYIIIFSLFKIKNSIVNQSMKILGFGCIILSIVLMFVNNVLDQQCVHNAWKAQDSTALGQWMEKHTRVKYKYCFPFASVYRSLTEKVWIDDYNWQYDYIKTKSIIAYAPSVVVGKLLEDSKIDNSKNIELSKLDETIINSLVSDNRNEIFLKRNPINLIYILVESLESWSLDTLHYVSYLPKLNELICKNHVCYASYISSQVLHGNSADGQMIGLTGLLPIASGATCKLYGDNKFPNFAHMYPNSAIVNPSKGVWQQATMTKSYEFKELIEPMDKEQWKDKDVIDNVLDYSFTNDSSFCVLGITITSHVPFGYGVDHVMYEFEGMPNLMNAYLNCLHYTDSCIGVLLDSVLNSPLAENTMIVITGDHTIFRDESGFSDMTKYAQENNIDFRAGHTFTPLIIYSPNIEGNIQITDTCYQMDIFPTILHLIGAEDYYWKGFGVNLLDSVARNNRVISEQEAYRLSDMIIRSDYFRHYCVETDSTNNSCP